MPTGLSAAVMVGVAVDFVCAAVVGLGGGVGVPIGADVELSSGVFAGSVVGVAAVGWLQDAKIVASIASIVTRRFVCTVALLLKPPFMKDFPASRVTIFFP